MCLVSESNFLPEYPEHQGLWACVLNPVSPYLSMGLVSEFYLNVLSYKPSFVFPILQLYYVVSVLQHNSAELKSDFN